MKLVKVEKNEEDSIRSFWVNTDYIVSLFHSSDTSIDDNYNGHFITIRDSLPLKITEESFNSVVKTLMLYKIEFDSKFT